MGILSTCLLTATSQHVGNRSKYHILHETISIEDIHRLYYDKVQKNHDYYAMRTNLTYWSQVLLLESHIDVSVRDMARMFPILDFKDWVGKYNLSHPKKLLSTHSTDTEVYFIKPEKKVLFTYRGQGSGDLHTLGRLDNPQLSAFDLVIISQTFEHLYDPYLCAINLFNQMTPGGYLYTSAPSQNVPHMTPIHFQHFRPIGFALLFYRAGFEIMEFGQWGNVDYERIILKTGSWPNLKKFQTQTNRNNLDSVSNDAETNPCQMWILVRKPLE
jgi:SAM-dependent methyltransferase